MRPLLLSFLVFLLFNCTDNNDQSSKSETDIDLVTGIDLRSTPNAAATRLGNPNTFTGANTSLLVYPNPPIELIIVSSDNTISNIWFIASNGEKVFQEVDFSNILGSETYSENEIQGLSVLTISNQESNSAQVDISSLASGYYKVFVKIEGNIYWDNIFVADDEFDYENFIESWN